jgi:hypothetical protein
MQWFIVDDVPGAETGMRAIVDADGTTVCNPSPMGAEGAALIRHAPQMFRCLQIIAATSTDAAARALADDLIIGVQWAAYGEDV